MSSIDLFFSVGCRLSTLRATAPKTKKWKIILCQNIFLCFVFLYLVSVLMAGAIVQCWADQLNLAEGKILSASLEKATHFNIPSTTT